MIKGSHARFSYRVFQRVTLVHVVVFLAAILFFYLSVRSYLGSPWLALAMATPLPYAAIWSLVRRIQPDFLASALALLTVSVFLLLILFPRALLWGGLTVLVFVTYQVRPAYLFLVVLLPLFGPWLRWLVSRDQRPQLSRFGLGLLAATAIPLLVFCTVRWMVVRDFGLVSFGGHNAIGVAASFMDNKVVRSLDRHRSLAGDILNQRKSRGMKPMPLGGDTSAWHSQHNKNVWGIAVPTAKRYIDREREQQDPRGPPPRAHQIVANDLLTEMSVDIFRQKPLLYLQWVADSIGTCIDTTLEENWIRWPLILIALSVPLALLGGLGTDWQNVNPGDRNRRQRLLAFAVFAVAFFFAHALIVVLVDVPYERFIFAMHLLIPPALLGILFELWRPASTIR